MLVTIIYSIFSLCTAAVDFDSAQLLITFPAGSDSEDPVTNTQCAAIGISDDTLVEGVESFNIARSASEGRFTQSVLTVFIEDNDSKLLSVFVGMDC